MHEFLQNSVFMPKPASFLIFALGAPLFSDFQQSTRVYTKQRFLPDLSTFVIFAVSVLLFSDFQQSAPVCALGTLLFNGVQQSARVCTKQRFQPKISTFSQWMLGALVLAISSELHEFVKNILFSPRSARF